MHASAEKLRNRNREVKNVNHKHSLRDREAEKVNVLKLHQKAFSIYQHYKHVQPHLICSSNRTTQITNFKQVHWIENYEYIQ